jgi:uncharacterized protein YjbI with pentapeptide repeats
MSQKTFFSVAGIYAALFFFIVSTAYAFCQADLNKLKSTNKCQGCNLSEADLSDWLLSKADLSDANLSGANLSHADLSGANLTRADLSYSYPSGADLSDANLSQANLIGAYLFETNLSGANLSDANFSYAIWIDGRTVCAEGSVGGCNR